MISRRLRTASHLATGLLMIGASATWITSVAGAEPQSGTSGNASDAPPPAVRVTQLFAPGSLKTDQGYPLTKPDDVVVSGRDLFVAFQNGVGPRGEAAGSGSTESTLLELTTDGAVVGQWDLTGKIDGLGADPKGHTVVATVNEDGNSSLYTVDPSAPDSGVTHYCFGPSPLPHGGGTDAATFFGDALILSASAPGPAPADVPAVYSVSLRPHSHPTNCPAGAAPATGTAVLTPGFSDTAPASPADPGAPSQLGLTDPDSNGVVPKSAPRFGGDFLLTSQGDDQQVYTPDPIGGSELSVLQLDQSVNDTAFVTSAHGVLYVTDAAANAVDRVTGPFGSGDVLVAVTPCSDNNAPSTCPAPGFPANYLGSLDLATGHVSQLSAALQPQGLVFARANGDNGPGGDGQGDTGSA